MEPYEVCVINGEDPLVLKFYASEEDYKDFNPSKVYVIAFKKLKEAYKKYRAEVKLLREDRDKAIIDIVTSQCYEVPMVIIPEWRRW
jgi:hypothetical protein